MDYHKLPDIDLRLLVIFEEIDKHRSLTDAATSLGISQPAISRSLQRLRHELADVLFIRTPHGMEPTPRAQALKEPVRQVLKAYFNEIASRPPFNPLTSKRRFTIQASDLGISIFLPALVRELKVKAPQVRIGAVTTSQKEALDALESGDIDLSIGAFTTVPERGIFQQRLFDQKYICLVRAGHPAVQSAELSIDTYLRQTHIIVVTGKSGHMHSRAEAILLKEIPALNIAMTVPSFALAAELLHDTDHVVTIPSAAATTFAAGFNLRCLPCPLPLPEFKVMQYWHERFTHDSASKWLRSLVHETFGNGHFLGLTPS
jgi:DNA-binding transcriptional LysR family regulator